jgi:hypothetical protein
MSSSSPYSWCKYCNLERASTSPYNDLNEIEPIHNFCVKIESKHHYFRKMQLYFLIFVGKSNNSTLTIAIARGHEVIVLVFGSTEVLYCNILTFCSVDHMYLQYQFNQAFYICSATYCKYAFVKYRIVPHSWTQSCS